MLSKNDNDINGIRMRARVQAVTAIIFIIVVASLIITGKIHDNSQTESLRRDVWQNANLSSLPADESRGEKIARAAGCITCHTNSENNGDMLAGGVVFATPIGQLISPNISSDKQYGIGHWNRDQLANALINGLAPDGSHYWPALPYVAYRSMKTQDVADLHAWLMSTKPISAPAAEHILRIPSASKQLIGLWKYRYVPKRPLPDEPVPVGQYLVQNLGHCAECHAQRGPLGSIADRSLKGNTRGPDGTNVPAITSHALMDWTVEDIAFYLEIGMTPEGDFAGAHMAPVVEHGTSHLLPEERMAIAEYLLSDANQ